MKYIFIIMNILTVVGILFIYPYDHKHRWAYITYWIFSLLVKYFGVKDDKDLKDQDNIADERKELICPGKEEMKNVPNY